jgi:hypothetical protein
MEYIANTLFFDHPKSVGETYFQHFKKAFFFGNKLLAFAIAEYIHALIPGIDIFKAMGTTSCDEIDKLSATLKQRQVSQESDKDHED